MYYDLNVPWPSGASFASASGGAGAAQKGKGKAKAAAAAASAAPSHDALAALSPTLQTNMEQLTADLQELGYGVLAFNHVLQTRYAGQLNPFHAPQATPSSMTPTKPPFAHLAPADSALPGKRKSKAIRQLSRLTLHLTDESLTKTGHGLTTANTNALLSYDLLSVRPTTEATFSVACLSLAELKPFSIDIISLDLSASSRLPFFLKRSTVGAALANGAVFEVCYGDALAQPESNAGGAESLARMEEETERKRRNVISGARELMRVTNGRGIILSSGASQLLGIRGPYDVVNLASIFGMSPQAARDCISATCRALLVRAETRRTYRGVVSTPSIGANLPPPAVLPPAPSAPTPQAAPAAKATAVAVPSVLSSPAVGSSTGKPTLKRKASDDAASTSALGSSGSTVQATPAHGERKTLDAKLTKAEKKARKRARQSDGL